MGAQIVQVLCADCLKKASCKNIPPEGKLLRCLDRQTVATPGYPASQQNPFPRLAGGALGSAEA